MISFKRVSNKQLQKDEQFATHKTAPTCINTHMQIYRAEPFKDKK